ncbi:MAG: maltotransferase domain-containing protein, partial [Longimicrobiales bacterium]
METSAQTRERKSEASAELERRRVIIEGVRPEIDYGRFPAKRAIGENVVVEADVFADGHDAVSCRVLWRPESGRTWRAVAMEPIGNDRWRGSFPADRLGRLLFTIEGWVDAFRTWQRDLRKRVDADDVVEIDFRIGAHILEETALRAQGQYRKALELAADRLSGSLSREEKTAIAFDARLTTLVARSPDLTHATTYAKELAVVIDPVRARFSTWYELFPR